MARKRQDQIGQVIDLSDMNIGVTKFSDAKEAVITDIIPTGFPHLDFNIGGGIPFGRLTEIYGVNSSGKSTLAVAVSKIAQNMNVDAVWIDVEGTLETKRLKELGLDPTRNLYLVQPKEKGAKLTVEEVGDRLINLIEASTQTGKRMIIIWDSVGATPTAEQLKQGIESKQLGLHAKAVTNLATQIGQDVTNSSVALIAINQARDKIGAFVPTVDSGGGNAFKHWASLRLQMNKGSADVEQRTNAFGKTENVRSTYKPKLIVKKSKVSIPNTEAELILIPELGLDFGANYFELLAMPSKYGILSKAGAYYKYTTDAGQELTLYKADWVNMINYPSDEQLPIVQELVQKMYIQTFPEGYIALNNEVIDIEAHPYFTGIRDRYKNLGAQITNPVEQPATE